MRTVGVVTVGRSDYGIYTPILQRIGSYESLQARLFVGGMHLSHSFGYTAKWIEDEGRDVAARVEMLAPDDSPRGISTSIGTGVTRFAEAFDASTPDILLVLGDRFEMLAAAIAAAPLNLPVAHIHGGETTEGAFDEGFRHCITKLSHLHFVSTHTHAARVVQLGEEPWRVTVSGAPSLDHLVDFEPLDDPALEERLGASLTRPFLLVTYHPVTLDYASRDEDVDELLQALDDASLPVVMTLPNADTGGRELGERLRTYAAARSGVTLADNLGSRAYFTLMSQASAMVGNSSSGIIEAASFELPVVNIGSRQAGRERAANIMDVPCKRRRIAKAIAEACSESFRRCLRGIRNPYGDGTASEQIVGVLESVEIDRRLLMKRFHMVSGGA